MKTKTVIATIAPFLLVGAMGATAGLFDKGEDAKKDESQQPAGQNAGMFNALDANRDQLISPQEAESSADVAMSFGELDKNTDGHLSADEFNEFETIQR
ncbi:flagellar basal body-associated protein FliL [Litorivivens lipolytica]|uniref:Flagellar basal body-associated protein FliL n=1 Tax=Litorivivens lipolytica TaxID=1524264 RepID=A0A7W4Z5J4_9GAMM|nr:hypothetical protein [Litorivivens lipolytica]MBB3047554.1 flagellar basal body-associated protein FliL [Litorivivens lipolytica]